MKTVLVEKENIEDVVKVLQRGDVVAFPTETVFGLGVKFGNINDLQKIYELKNRDRSKAVTLMLAKKEDISQYAYVGHQVKKVIDAFMPGMITLILKKKDLIDDNYTAGLQTIGIRIPDDPFVLALLAKVGPMLVTSANISGNPALLNDQDVYQQFHDRIPLIVKGKCVNNLASTVVQVDKEVKVLRQGLISKEMIEEVLL
ncbi:MAG: L-threonylcarbamoyladenylate synthase [Faecalibacillus sp.]